LLGGSLLSPDTGWSYFLSIYHLARLCLRMPTI